MFRDLFAAAHLAAGVEQADQPGLRHGVDEARAADPFGRDVAPDHLQLDTVAQGHAFDRAVGRAHAAADLAAFERWAGRRRGAEDALDRAKDDLAVGPDVHEDAELVLARQAGGHDARDDVRADVGADDGKRLDVATGMNIEADLPGGKVE